MNQPIVECVPNFSEGKDERVIDAIAEAIRQERGTVLLNVDSNRDADRTVMTFAGKPESVLRSAYAAIKTAAEKIDLRHKKGKHPRMGATDVCPLIPLRNMKMEDAIVLAERLAEKVGDELNIPVYLYEYAAKSDSRRSLPQIRKGEFEKLHSKISDPEWKPDHGPEKVHTTAGASVIGARNFLIAYNINLKTKDAAIAHKIAQSVRESGKKVIQNGEKVHIPGKLKALRAIGWYLEDFDCAQVSLNLLNFWQTNMAEAYETVKETARELGTDVNGSELVGMIPVDAVAESVSYYDSANKNLSEEKMVKLLNEKLQLDAVKPFAPQEKIIEWKLSTLAPEVFGSNE